MEKKDEFEEFSKSLDKRQENFQKGIDEFREESPVLNPDLGVQNGDTESKGQTESQTQGAEDTEAESVKKETFGEQLKREAKQIGEDIKTGWEEDKERFGLNKRKNKKESNVNPDDVVVANGKIPGKESISDIINNTRPTLSQEEIDELKRKAENGEDLNAKPEEKPFDKAATEEFSNSTEQRQEDFHNNIENIKSQTNPEGYVPQNTETEGNDKAQTETDKESLQQFADSIPDREKEFTGNVENIRDGLDGTQGTDAETQETTEPDDTETDEKEAPENPPTNGAGTTAETAGNTASAGNAPAGDTNTPTAPDYDNNPRVKATREANEIIDKAYNDPENGYFKWYKDFIEEQQKYNEEQERRDRQAAFWNGIGEVGASLVNLLGVSGAFNGRNAYGRGAYSAMQKFDLTTGKMTEKMKADMEKRKERMDALKQKQAELGLQWAQLKAQGVAAEGEAKGKVLDDANKAAEAQKNRDWQSAEAKAQREFQVGENAKGRASNERIAKEKTPKETQTKEEEHDVFTYETKDGGKKHLVATRKSFNHAFENTSGQLADAIARELGYKNYDDYSIAKERGLVRKTKETELEAEWKDMSDDDKNEFIGDGKKWDEMGNKEKNAAQKKYVDKGLEDFDIHVKRLERYEFAREMRPFLGEDNKMHNGVAQWARDIARYYEEYGDDIYDWLQLNGALFGDNSSDDIPQPPNAD